MEKNFAIRRLLQWVTTAKDMEVKKDESLISEITWAEYRY